MHKNSCQVKLYLKSNINISSIDCRTPPKCESSIRYLIKTRPLSMSKFFIFHRFFKPGCFFPEKTFPGNKVGSCKKSMFQDSLYSSQTLNHISSIVIKIPQFSIMFLVCPPERILFEYLILFKILSDSPSFIVG